MFFKPFYLYLPEIFSRCLSRVASVGQCGSAGMAVITISETVWVNWGMVGQLWDGVGQLRDSVDQL